MLFTDFKNSKYFLDIDSQSRRQQKVPYGRHKLKQRLKKCFTPLCPEHLL